MKKKSAIILLTILASLAAGSTVTFASGQGFRTNYTDSNQDSICDHSQNLLCCDEDRDGICDYHSSEETCQTSSNCRYNCSDSDTCQYKNHNQGSHHSHQHAAGHHAGHHAGRHR